MQQEIIRRIIEMDKDARRLTEEAEQRREAGVKAAAAKKSEVSERYLSLVRQRVETVRTAELAEANEQLAVFEKKAAAAEKALDACFEQNHERWARELAERALEEKK